MIYFVRTATIAQGKVNEAFEWAVRVASLINDKYPGHNVQVLRAVTGPLFEIRWLSTGDSLADLEQVLGKLEADPDYQNLLAENRRQGIFETSSIRDSYFRTVP